jgi:hypothetical protein
MKKSLIVLLILFSSRVFGQHIFKDTSLYFIKQIDSLNPVGLTAIELDQLEKFLIKAVDEFNQSQQRYADSVNPKKKKNRFQAQRIDATDYFFKLVPRYNKQNQKEVWISGDSKDFFMNGKKKKPTYDPDRKRKFIKGTEVLDGGSFFIYIIVNLTHNNHGPLTMNGSG